MANKKIKLGEQLKQAEQDHKQSLLARWGSVIKEWF